MDIVELFNDYADGIYNFLVYFTRNPHLAEDLTQETFMKAIQRQHEFRGGHARAWLLQIARNKAIDHFRKQKHESPVDMGVLADMPGKLSGPEKLAESNDTLIRLLTLLNSLKPDYRDVVLYRLIMDMSSSEVASVLGWTPNRVRVMLHRALQAIREAERKEEWLHGLSE